MVGRRTSISVCLIGQSGNPDPGSLSRTRVSLRASSRAFSDGPFRNENFSGKFEPSAQFPHLFQGEIALSCHEHRNRTLRTKLRNEVTLCEILLFNDESHNRNRVTLGDGVMLLLVTFHKQG